jgi:predicted DNA-binding ribbon-helix-helix protein
MPVQRGGRKRKRFQKVRSAVLKRTIVISGRRTGVSLEDAFWNAMHEIAVAKGTTRMGLIRKIERRRKQQKQLNLSSAIRLFVLAYYQGLHRSDQAMRKPSRPSRSTISAMALNICCLASASNPGVLGF